jgi:hypothetical protein
MQEFGKNYFFRVKKNHFSFKEDASFCGQIIDDNDNA